MSLPIQGCTRCHRAIALGARIKGEFLCPACWRAAGSPSADPLGDAHELEVKTRERMTARGSTDRHMVRSGKS